jgi:hypothetical protein
MAFAFGGLRYREQVHSHELFDAKQLLTGLDLQQYRHSDERLFTQLECDELVAPCTLVAALNASI